MTIEKCCDSLKAFCTDHCSVPCYIANIAYVALLIIGASAVAGGVFPGYQSTMGWTMIGIGGGAAIISCFGEKPKERIFQLIFCAITATIFVGVGAAGVSGALSTHQLGVATLVMTLGVVGCCGLSYMGYDRLRNKGDCPKFNRKLV